MLNNVKIGIHRHIWIKTSKRLIFVMESLPIIQFVFNRRKTATKTTPATLELQISYKGQRKWISTKVKLNINQWNGTNVMRHPDMYALNQRLSEMITTYQNAVDRIRDDGVPFSFSVLEEYLSEKLKSKNFIDFITERIEERKDIKESTKKSQRKIINALNDFGRITSFGQINQRNIMAFDEWLHGKGYAQTTVSSYHKFMKIYIGEAIRLEYISRNPYLGFKVDRGKPKGRRYLTEAEILKIANSKDIPESLNKVKDLFLFQCFTGLAFADMQNFDFKKVKLRNGKYVMLDTRQKTEEEYYIVLLSPALNILKKYDFQLPRISNAQYNLRLKSMAAIAGIDRAVTSHMARHSFAVWCINKNVPMESLAKMMGHSNTNTTQIYAKLLDSTLEKDFGKLEEEIDNSGIAPAYKISSTVSTTDFVYTNESQTSAYASWSCASWTLPEDIL